MKGILYHHTRKLLSVLAIICLPYTGLSSAGTDIFDPDAEYSAVRVIQTDEGEAVMRVFHARDKERFVIESEGQTIAVITRLDKQTSWILMPDEKMYLELPMDQAADRMEDFGISQEAALRLEGKPPENFKKVGTESIAGLKTTKYTGQIGENGSRERGTATYWVTDSGIVAKWVYDGTDEAGNPQSVTMELRELKIGKQAPELFAPPADYEPIRLDFGAMFGAGAGLPPRDTGQGDMEGENDIVSDIAREAGDEAQSTVTDEVKRSVRDAVKGLFGR